ncbi:hypothetical protein ACA910_004875 [Epithemia clementina (nom. ined.)]
MRTHSHRAREIFFFLLVLEALISESECFLASRFNYNVGARKLHHDTTYQSDCISNCPNQRSCKSVLVNVATIGGPGLTNSTSSNESSSILEKVISQAAEGIGGKGGRVFDVNALKRNLLQETMLAYKYEFFKLLNTPKSTEQEIVEKLSALVEGSPVRTTTDSNLLDGTWALAYTSKHSSVRNLREFFKNQKLRRSENSKDVIKTPAMKRISGKGTLFKSVQHSFRLEELEDDDDPHVIEQVSYFGGIYNVQRRSTVEALTRQTLQLRPVAEIKSFFGGSFARESPVVGKPSVDLHIVYADVNICITARNGDSQHTYEVFTKNESWLDTRKSFERRMAYTTAWLASLFTAFLPGVKRRRLYRDEADPMLREIYVDSAHLRVLKLGSTVNEDDDAWDSVADPFIHLSADERQKLLKAMSVREIERAGIQRRSKHRRDRWIPSLFSKRRRTFFHVPDLRSSSSKTDEKGFNKPTTNESNQ